MTKKQRRKELEEIVLGFGADLRRSRDVDPERFLELWLAVREWVLTYARELGVVILEDV